MKLKPQKCSFLQEKVCYLGHIVSRDGIATDPAKTEKVKTWPVPANSNDSSGSQITTESLFAISLTSQNHYIDSPNEHPHSSGHTNVRRKLTTAPTLAYPDYAKSFILDTDARDTGIGAVLSQLDSRGCE